MAYSGSSVPIILGPVGLVTDDPISALPLNALQRANNVSFQNGRLSKMQGTTKYNSTALSDDIVAAIDYWPTSVLQRLIVMTADGKIFRDTGDTTFTGQVPIATGLGVLTTDSHFATGGAEYAGRNKKLFAFTGTSQIQVLSGDSSTPTVLNFPSPDWATGNFPTYGLVYQGRLCVLGSASNRHQVYFSTQNDHENFAGQTFPDARWELWRRVAATPNVDETATVQAGTAITLFSTTNNDGFLLYGKTQFNTVEITVSQAQTGSPVYTYEYWNGTAWTALNVTTTPTYTSTGVKTLVFDIPTAWVVGDGTESGGNANYYAIRGLATTAPTQNVRVTDITVKNSLFDVAPPTFAVFPGEGDGLISAYVYRGVLFLFKKPYGVYIIDGTDPNSNNWKVLKYSDSFGVSSPHAVLQVLGDLIAANSNGSLTSLEASQKFGDFESGDILQNAKVEEYIRSQISFNGLPFSQAVYYPEKKIAMFTAQSGNSTPRNRIIGIDVGRDNPRIFLINKDQPNCLALRKDQQGISRPMYGAEDGHIYLMDQLTYNVDGSPYLGEFQTAYTDFGQLDASLAGKNKIFEFLEVNYVPTGNNDFSVDVYIDGDFRQTLSFTQFLGNALDSFVLDVDSLAADPSGNRNRKPLKSCTGNKISLRFYNNLPNQAFQIERVIVGFRVSDEKVYSTQV